MAASKEQSPPAARYRLRDGSGRGRWAAFALAAVLHGSLVVGLIAAFAPDVGRTVAQRALTATTFASPPVVPPASASKVAKSAGSLGRRAVGRPIVAPAPRVELAAEPAALAASTGAAPSFGTGASGSGPGSGAEGEGAGGGSPVLKIAGDINSARDYPIASRDLRIGDYVIIVLTVGLDGAPTACRIHRASRDADADAITCRLAMARFRFRPATDAAGHPVEGMYGWQQKWHY